MPTPLFLKPGVARGSLVHRYRFSRPLQLFQLPEFLLDFHRMLYLLGVVGVFHQGQGHSALWEQRRNCYCRANSGILWVGRASGPVRRLCRKCGTGCPVCQSETDMLSVPHVWLSWSSTRSKNEERKGLSKALDVCVSVNVWCRLRPVREYRWLHQPHDYILITNLMHWLLFIHKILFFSTCFEPQVPIFRRIQLYTCSIWYCYSLWKFQVACRYTAWVSSHSSCVPTGHQELS